MRYLKRLRARADERGMTTSEYAVGTVGACTVGGAIYSIATSDWFNDFLKNVFEKGVELLPFM
ncbi:DUF4244 domain-containing protein [Mumia zhuanghuii]|jgi:hypothetical protein|uniref:DUF4244 domain-containing protein n=1 Tax=Mumia zhuanghuii TaxID=2585211 RepID=A0A5C4MUW6_9ACTN|nr:DUF4244 domain-containing protein [Mumia zhuanghuii]TNC49734.1 DUF4244 domain-containing protein [Mumia zhuanghuii]TNC49961.1 DUF4244 domain-containing protein [Mumia zhuanghuii]